MSIPMASARAPVPVALHVYAPDPFSVRRRIDANMNLSRAFHPRRCLADNHPGKMQTSTVTVSSPYITPMSAPAYRRP